ncbi:MAG: NRDE family protein [Gammaproteobacteria bacterium]
MCLCAAAIGVDANWPVVLVGNRDEFFSRPTQPLHRWEARPLLAGKDLVAGGTWLAIDPTSGRWAALTNVRQQADANQQYQTRGVLIPQTICADDIWASMQQLRHQTHKYLPFNLIAGDATQAYTLGSQQQQLAHLKPPFVRTLSNCCLSIFWHKQRHLQQDLHALLAQSHNLSGIDLLHRCAQMMRQAPLHIDQPSAGDDSAAAITKGRFLISENYGTRSTTVVLWRSADEYLLLEIQYCANNGAVATTTLCRKEANSQEIWVTT